MSYKVSVYPESFEGKDKSYIAKQSKKITALIPRNRMKLGVEGLAAMIENKQG